MVRAIAAASICWLALVSAGSAQSPWRDGAALGATVEGVDRALWRMPPEAGVADYANDGYQLKVREGWVEVEVQVLPLGSKAPFELPAGSAAPDAPEILARRLASGAETRYQAVSRVLGWVARNIRYDLDRERSQEPGPVLERRSAYCTGIARLSVALLARLGIEAREVSGFVFSDAMVTAEGYHRWVEVLYPDRGWVFSDPLYSHHFVPANYVRLASERLDLDRRGPVGEGLFRERRLAQRDVYPAGPAGVLARRNSDRQLAGALRIVLDPPVAARLALAGGGAIRRATVGGGDAATFVGLEPDSYWLEVSPEDGSPPITRRVHLRDRVRSDVVLRLRPWGR
ncbi:MAG TPA: transglutaminase-like domain-containing protein [Thermoanaerobaculia bacterium]|nr:transglutaminase-like domain-containing protein [Thermoanaerobaculia bacterium]